MPLRWHLFITDSANGLMHSLAEFYSMKLFFPNQRRSGVLCDWLLGFIEVLLFVCYKCHAECVKS